jgi:1-acyl-sn-glycerol-3-phosphate acyltransferase
MDLIELVQTPEAKSAFQRLLKFLKDYFRVEVEGLEYLPPTGNKGVVCPNHSGYAGTDAVLLADLIHERTGRRPRILAHRAFFDFSKQIKAVSESFGLQKASIENGIAVQNRKHLLILFPEGERGNFKPTVRRYRLQEFRTGFLRVAIASGAPIIPCVIIGAEESHLNLGSINLSKLGIKGLRIPLPLTLIPLPAKWKIKFLPPIDTTLFDKEILEDPKRLRQLARKIRLQLQRAIHDELRSRKYVFSEESHDLAQKVEKSKLVQNLRGTLRKTLTKISKKNA